MTVSPEDVAGIATALSAGNPVIYIWDNNKTLTHYEIIFTPLHGTRIASDLEAKARITRPHMVLVSLPDWRSCYVFNLFTLYEQTFHPDYIREKLGLTGPDAAVVAELLEAIQQDLRFQNIDLGGHSREE